MMSSLNKSILSSLTLFIIAFCSTNCTSTKSKNSTKEGYSIINTYFKDGPAIELRRRTLDISSYSANLEKLEFWNDANDDLANNTRTGIDFETLFSQREFSNHISKFTTAPIIRLDKSLLSKRIQLKKKAPNIISYPYIFEKKGVEYAMLYSEVTNGPENAAGGVILFQKKGTIWEEIFYYRLWIS